MWSAPQSEGRINIRKSSHLAIMVPCLLYFKHSSQTTSHHLVKWKPDDEGEHVVSEICVYHSLGATSVRVRVSIFLGHVFSRERTWVDDSEVQLLRKCTTKDRMSWPFYVCGSVFEVLLRGDWSTQATLFPLFHYTGLLHLTVLLCHNDY